MSNNEITQRTLFFISDSIIPKNLANVGNTLRMAEALAIHDSSLTLIARTEPGYSSVDTIWQSIELLFGVKKYSFNFFPAPSRYISYILYTLLKIYKNQHCLIYSRSLLFASLLSLLKYKVFFHAHSDLNSSFPKGFIKKILFKSKPFKIFCVSEGMKKVYLEEYGVAENRLKVIRNGVPIDKFEIEEDKETLRAKLSIPIASFVCLYTGSLYPGRGVDLIKIIATQLSDITFLMVGGTQEDIARELPLSPTNMIYTGNKPYLHIPMYMKAADILLMPYQFNVGLADKGKHRASILGPIKMYEYLASGTVMVTSDLPSLREILCDNTAVFAHPEKPKDWIKNLELLRNNAKMRFMIGDNAKRTAQKHDLRKRAKEILIEMGVY